MNVDLSWQKGHESFMQTKYKQHLADPRTHLFNGRKERKKKMGGNDKGKKERRGKKGMENALSLTFWVFRIYTCSLSIYKISLGALWYCAGPCGIPGQKSLSGACIFWLQKIGFIQTLGPSLSSKEQVQTIANWGREGDAETELRQEPKKQQCSLGGSAVVPLKGGTGQ